MRLLSLERLRGLILGVILALCGMVISHCNLIGDPSVPPLNIYDTVTTWNSEIIIDSAEAPKILGKDSLTKEIARNILKGPVENHSLDTTQIIQFVKSFQILALYKQSTRIKIGKTCRIDRGIAGSTLPPDTLVCEPVQQVIGTERIGPQIDTIFLDSLFDTTLVLPNSGPIVLVPNQDSTFRVNLNFPDAQLPKLTIYNGDAQTLSLSENAWPGTYKFSPKFDSLQLVWPQGQAPSGKTSGILGRFSGTLTLYEDATHLFTDLPYSFSRQWYGLKPKKTLYTDWWSLVGKISNLYEPDSSKFILSASAAIGDSVTALHSLFSLKGDFEINTSIQWTAKPGVFLAFMISDSAKPGVEYRPMEGRRQAGFDFKLGYNCTGVSLNYNGLSSTPNYWMPNGLSPTPSNILIPSHAKIRFARRNSQFELNITEATAISSGPAKNWITDNSGNLLPDQVKLHLFVGKFSGAATDVTFGNFTITQGEWVAP